MTGASMKVEMVGAKEVRRRLDNLVRAGGDAAPLMRDIGERVLNATRDRFSSMTAMVKAPQTFGIYLWTAQVTIRRKQALHATRRFKDEKGAKLNDADFDRLPEILNNPEAVLLDTEGKGRNKGQTLLYVFSPAEKARKGKVVVRVNCTETQRDSAGNRAEADTNAIVTAGYVRPRDLRDRRYRVLEGKVECGRA